MKGKNLWIVIVVLLVFVGCQSVSTYNNMVGKQETATTAWADVQASYQRRADLIPNLAKSVAAYAKHEKETLEGVIQARASATQIKVDAENLTPEKLEQFQKAQGELSQALGRLMAVAENYPELKANENYKALMVQLEGTENRINEARQKYNGIVEEYNTTVRRFPASIFAGIFGFDRMTKFESSEGADKAPELNFD